MDESSFAASDALDVTRDNDALDNSFDGLDDNLDTDGTRSGELDLTPAADFDRVVTEALEQIDDLELSLDTDATDEDVDSGGVDALLTEEMRFPNVDFREASADDISDSSTVPINTDSETLNDDLEGGNASFVKPEGILMPDGPAFSEDDFLDRDPLLAPLSALVDAVMPITDPDLVPDKCVTSAESVEDFFVMDDVLDDFEERSADKFLVEPGLVGDSVGNVRVDARRREGTGSLSSKGLVGPTSVVLDGDGGRSTGANTGLLVEGRGMRDDVTVEAVVFFTNLAGLSSRNAKIGRAHV